MLVYVTNVDGVRAHGENLSIVTVGEHEVVANRLPSGDFRWEPGETCVYVSENAIIPEHVLKERGYWNDEKGKGLLGGSKGNRVKMQRFAGHESRGLLFKVVNNRIYNGGDSIEVNIGNVVAEFFGITEYLA